MEAFEAFVALSLEAEGFVVSEAVKFPLRRQTKRETYVEVQRHGYEVDLVGARSGRLVVATVKSFLGSRGVVAEEVMGSSSNERGNRGYAMLNDPAVSEAILKGAEALYGYSPDQIEFRLYAGRIAAPTKPENEAKLRAWCASQSLGAGEIKVFGVVDVATAARRLAESKSYRDNPALVAIKVLEAAGMLRAVEPAG